MILRKRYKKVHIWCSVNWGQIGFGITGTKYVPIAMYEFKYQLEINILCAKIIFNFL